MVHLRDIHHNVAVRIFVRVHRVEAVTGVGFDPGDIGVGAVARHHAKPRAELGCPPKRETLGRSNGQVKHIGLVEKQHIVGGNCKIVHRNCARQIDGRARTHRAVGFDGVEIDVWLDEPITESNELVRAGIDLGMRSHPVRQVARIEPADRVEIAIQQVRQSAFGQRKNVASETHDVGVRRVEVRLGRTIDARFAKEIGDRIGTHIPIAIRQRLAAAKLNPVNHAVAQKPLVRLGRGNVRVRTSAKVPTVERLGDRAHDLKIGVGDLIGDGRVVAGEVGIRRRRSHGHRRSVFDVSTAQQTSHRKDLTRTPRQAVQLAACLQSAHLPGPSERRNATTRPSRCAHSST